MPIETDPSSNDDGGTTTVGSTVRDSGPGTDPRTLDIYLHIQSSKFTLGGHSPASFKQDIDRIVMWWKDVTLPAGGTLNVSCRLVRRPGDAFEGPAEGTITVTDRGTDNPELHVKRFSIP